jgi:glycyl-tRNA synthetase
LQTLETHPLDFQSMIFTLQRFWAEKGCMIWQPYYSQVGAGTMNPATVLRVLGPEPWNVVYVEPSIRPDDGRYGDNPYRLQQHYQMQVILKPDPGNPQELYLQSLQALGIDPRKHDIRFVEDNWDSPALGAWGLGWEVWLDGQEITQFTYFQHGGGIALDPVSVEITYGLERIAMPLQRVHDYRAIRWNENLTYGDVNYLAEREHSTYYFEAADVERLRQMYALYQAEAEAALRRGLVLPAHDYILKCSHTFNILDSRGAIGVTERQALFGGMRDLSRRVAELYLLQRQHLEYPFMPDDVVDQKVARQQSTLKDQTSSPIQITQIDGKASNDFLFEIGCEELPANDLQTGIDQLRERVPTLLDDLCLTHGMVQVLGTPRRLTVFVKDMAVCQVDRTSIIKGPPASRAYDSLGIPTPAAQGFARSRGVDVKALEVREIDGGKYVVAIVSEIGRPAMAVLAEALPRLISSLKFEKTMRWNWSNVFFSRPIRWLLGLLGEQVIPFEYAGLDSSNTTRGQRFRTPETFPVKDAQAYFSALAEQGILLDVATRRQAIAEQVSALMVSAGGSTQLDPSLLDEVTMLVEAPTALLGKFEESHLRLPPEVLVSVMKKHQRYFPVRTTSGKLLPFFITVRNGDSAHLDIVTDGNEQVIRARFADALFFVGQDLHHTLEDFLPRLGTLMFQTRLGSVLDKSRRISKLVEGLLSFFAIDEADCQVARRAAYLCKADLVSHMVVEMTSLQGVMGRNYALKAGESPDVAQAIYEHYLPRYAGDEVPRSKAGLIIGIADRLDTIAGLFTAGLAPSGTKDPFAQRRAALGLVQSLIEWNLDFDLHQGLSLASEILPLPSSIEIQNACLDFIAGRLRAYLIEQEGFHYDVVDSVLASQRHNPAGVMRAVRQLTEIIAQTTWSTTLPAFSRCVRITRDQQEQFVIHPDTVTHPAEKDLYQALLAAEATPRQTGSIIDFMLAFLPMIPTINRFFEEVLVMAEDPQVRSNRLGMLQRIANLTKGVADLSLLEGF